MQTAAEFADIEEVLLAGNFDLANAYLESGYKLLAVSEENDWREAPAEVKKKSNGRVQGWVHRRTAFVVGRPSGVARLAGDAAHTRSHELIAERTAWRKSMHLTSKSKD